MTTSGKCLIMLHFGEAWCPCLCIKIFRNCRCLYGLFEFGLDCFGTLTDSPVTEPIHAHVL